VRLAWHRPAEVLGLDVPRAEVEKILSGLGFQQKGADAAGATWGVPTYRVDVSIEEDLIEEVARTKGYDAVPETLPDNAVATPAEPDEARAIGRIRAALEAAGFSEAVNFSFVAAKDLEPFGETVVTGDGTKRALGVTLKNPISAELSVMRTSLVPSLLENAVLNRRQRVEDVRLYEIARTYTPSATPAAAPADEPLRVAGVLLGRRHPVSWAVGSDTLDFADAKAAVQGLLDALGIAGVTWRPGGPGWVHPRTSALLERGPEVLGAVGELHPRVAAAFDLPRGVHAFELSFDALLRAARLVPQYRRIPHLPAVLRDLAVVVEEGVTTASVEALIREESLVDGVTLFDVYRGAPLAQGKKNLALAIRYRAPDRTLTDADADAAHGRIVERLKQQVHAELRG
jgi:phenylalanyl-tRNA synthetase beta chain